MAKYTITIDGQPVDYGRFTSNVRIARKIAAKHAKHRQHKMAALLLRGGKLVSVGWNRDTIHAEHSALNRAWRSNINGASVFVIRLRKNGSLGMSKPCDSCIAKLIVAGIRKVIYSNHQGELEIIKLSGE